MKISPYLLVLARESSRLKGLFDCAIRSCGSPALPLTTTPASCIDGNIYLFDQHPYSRKIYDSYLKLTGVKAVMDCYTPICSSPESLISAIHTLNLTANNWTLSCEVASVFARDGGAESSLRREVPSKMLMCAIAQHIRGPPLLSSSLPPSIAFTVVESTSGYFFGSNYTTTLNAGAKESPEANQWRKRPYSFSAALSFDAAAAICRILLTHFQRSNPSKPLCEISLYDPCCGSGTTLFAALRLGLERVSGSDINPGAIEGSIKNLVFCGYDYAQVKGMLSCRDATVLASSAYHCDPFDLMLVNLPWGENKFQYFGENDKIIMSLHKMLHKSSQIAIISHEPLEAKLLNRAGLEIREMIPLDQNAESNNKRVGKCVISFLVYDIIASDE